ncbi:MAG: cell division protein FtsA [Bacilli bacterium]|nr:cell division protein FtsA [Bacilli bacterium]
MSEVYTAIDMGTNSIKIVVCQKIEDKFQVLTSVSSPSMGIENGFVTDMKAAISSVKMALKEVEERLNFMPRKAIVCIPPFHCQFDIVGGEVNVGDYNNITGEDISKVLQNSIEDFDFQDRELVTILPISFTVDGKEVVKDPKGMKGTKLESRGVITTTLKEPLYRILEVLNLSGVDAVDICFSSLGDYYTIKNRKYDDLVGAIINIGEESTNISVFNKGIQIKNSLIPVGSLHVDKDLTYAFKAKNDEARKIKERFSVCLSSYADSNDVWEFYLDKENKKEINQVTVSKVVEARVRELLKLAKNEIKNLTNREIRYIIVTGGLSEISGFTYLIEQEFGFIAKVCSNPTMGVRHNQFSSCFGVIKYFDEKLALREKHYNMVSKEDMDKMLSIDASLTNENVINKVFGHFFDN